MNSKWLLFLSCLSIASIAAPGASIPSVENVTLGQAPGQRTVKISYSLKGGPAVITMDIQTNNSDSGWVSIGVDTIYSPGYHPKGDVNKPVEVGERLITWRPVKTWMAKEGVVRNARAVLTAWPLDDKPPYMVVDVSAAGADSADRIRYYQSEEFLPGGLLTNESYRKTSLVLKKVIAKNITWTMGTIHSFGDGGNEKAHCVTMDHNYYLGVFPLTQSQLDNIQRSAFKGNFQIDGAMRLRDQIRYDTYTPYARGANSPLPPAPTSILGQLRTMTGQTIDFDLPPESCWEFACRAGTGDGYWNTGDPICANSQSSISVDENIPGRYLSNQAIVGNLTQTTDVASGTPIAGSYEPNDWGFYDMHGGVLEWCQDWYQADISSLNGLVNVSEDGATCRDGTTTTRRVLRGGCWCYGASGCRSTSRSSMDSLWCGDYGEAGLRVYCRAGLK